MALRCHSATFCLLWATSFPPLSHAPVSPDGSLSGFLLVGGSVTTRRRRASPASPCEGFPETPPSIRSKSLRDSAYHNALHRVPPRNKKRRTMKASMHTEASGSYQVRPDTGTPALATTGTPVVYTPITLPPPPGPHFCVPVSYTHLDVYKRQLWTTDVGLQTNKCT